MNLRQLEILRAVLRCGTTVEAARELGMSQPAVSNALKHAESQLGFVLFDRVSNRLIPTEEARVLLAEAEPLFSIHEAVTRTAIELRRRKRGRLRVIATTELTARLIPRALARFVAAHPEVEVSLDTSPLGGVLEAIEVDAYDVGVAIEPHVRPDLVLTPLDRTAMVVVAPTGHRFATLAAVTPADLAPECLVGLDTTSRLKLMVEEAFRRSGESFRPHVTVRFCTVAAALVDEGLGVAIIDEATALTWPEGRLLVRPFLPRIDLTTSAITKRDRPQSRFVRIFLDAVSAVCAESRRGRDAYGVASAATDDGRSTETGAASGRTSVSGVSPDHIAI